MGENGWSAFFGTRRPWGDVVGGTCVPYAVSPYTTKIQTLKCGSLFSSMELEPTYILVIALVSNRGECFESVEPDFCVFP